MNKLKEKTIFFKYKEKDIITVRHSIFNHKSFKKHMHNELSIGLILDGQAKVEIDDAEYFVQKNDLVIVNPRQHHACNPSTENAWTYYMFYINEEWFCKKVSEITNIKFEKIRIENSVFRNKNLFKQIENLFYLIKVNENIMSVEEAIYSIIQKIIFDKIESPAESESADLDAAIDFMEKEIENNLSLEDIADEVGLSPYHFLRKFKTRYGITPYQYFINLKINKSRKLIEKGSSPSDVAYQVGFYDQSHFIKKFKDCTGVTPGEYSNSISH